MGRWTQFEEDSYRLPEGMKRIGYDADTKVYTFRDRKGILYQGAPGADYGTLTPISNTGVTARPGAFESEKPRKQLTLNPEAAPSTFQDILPPNLITATTSPVDGKSPRSPTSPKPTGDPDKTSPRIHFADAVRRAALPKMQGVVHNLRRSVTSARRRPPSNEDSENLLHRGPSTVTRSTSIATTRSGVSVSRPVSISRT